MTLGEFMVGTFLLGFGALCGAVVMHYIIRGVRFVWWCMEDFIEAWGHEYERRPYDHRGNP